jgi:transcriptional regulator with XRE-family HTH domain
MDYPQLFRSLREAKGLTLEQLARASRVHRNTVTNIESGRPVKFKTIAALTRKMGYADRSPEMKAIALLWLESVSGLTLSRDAAESAARRTVESHRSAQRHALQKLEQQIAASHLTPQQIELLGFAVRNPEIIEIVASIRELAGSGAGEKSTLPHAAEDAAGYDAR